MALENFVAPNLPSPPPVYSQQYMEQLSNALRLYFAKLDSEAANKAYTYRTNGVIFNADGLPSLTTGQLSWDSANATLTLGMEYNVFQQIGEEWYARVQNNTGVTIPSGTVVGFAGVGADRTLLVAPYQADGMQPTLYLLGVMAHDLPDDGSRGYATVWGSVRTLNTTGSTVSETWTQGDILYASPTTAGAFTKVKPTAPNNCVPVAAVTYAHATDGEIFVRPTIEQQKYYGVFTKTTNQSAAAINTEYLVTFDNTQISNGVTIGTPTSRLVAPQSGLYQINLTAQLSSSSASQKEMWVWLKDNGTALPNSARTITVSANGGYAPITMLQSVSMHAGDYIEVAFAVSDTTLSLATVAATAFAPAAPAVVLSMTQVQL